MPDENRIDAGRYLISGGQLGDALAFNELTLDGNHLAMADVLAGEVLSEQFAETVCSMQRMGYDSDRPLALPAH